MNNIDFKQQLDSHKLHQNKTIQECGFNNNDEVYVFYDGIKPIKKEVG